MKAAPHLDGVEVGDGSTHDATRGVAAEEPFGDEILEMVRGNSQAATALVGGAHVVPFQATAVAREQARPAQTAHHEPAQEVARRLRGPGEDDGEASELVA